jgi:NAD(P)-dependent dehydrogenase (short-subunit alcohol dehydrogenase family)
MTNLFRLDGKKALVTGAATGIGEAIALALAEAGADVACHGNSRPPDAVAERVTALGRKGIAVRGNLAKAESATELVGATLEAFGRIDILINNAGMIRRAPAVEFSDADFAEVIEVNLTSVFRLCKLAGKSMLERGEGKIVAAVVSGRHHRARLRGVEGWRRAAHQGAGQRVGVQGRQRQRHRSRLHPHRKHRRAPAKRDTQSPDPRAHSGGALG